MNELQQALQNGIVHVVFEKKDGSIREMLCTTVLEIIPESKHPKGESTVKLSDTVRRVYDLEADGWRSFRVDSVIEWHSVYEEAA